VFLALLFGAWTLGQAAPNLQDVSVALGAAGYIYDTIDRVSQKHLSSYVIDSTGKVPTLKFEAVEGKIMWTGTRYN